MQSELVIEHAEVIEIVQNTVRELEQSYLFPQRAAQVREDLSVKVRLGEFDRHYTFARLKHTLESMLIPATGDSNFEYIQRASFGEALDQAEATSASSVSSQILDGNIGYVELTGDLAFSSTEKRLNSAFEHLTAVDALIIDLRDAGPGTIGLVQHTMNFFFPSGTHLADVFFGKGEKQSMYSSRPDDIAAFNPDLPVFVLTSGFVAGPWEFFSYTLKHHERATVVGDDTMGLGFMTTTIPVSKHVNLVLSYAHTKHPVSNENWQDIGVIADYQTTASESLDKAYELAIEAVEAQRARQAEAAATAVL